MPVHNTDTSTESFWCIYIPFVLDTPNVLGNRWVAACYAAARESHPSCRSDRAAQCCDAFKTGVALKYLTVMAMSGATQHSQSVGSLTSCEGRGGPAWTGSCSRTSDFKSQRMTLQFSRFRRGLEKVPSPFIFFGAFCRGVFKPFQKNSLKLFFCVSFLQPEEILGQP